MRKVFDVYGIVYIDYATGLMKAYIIGKCENMPIIGKIWTKDGIKHALDLSKRFH